MRDPFERGYSVEVKPAKKGEDDFWAGVGFCFLVLMLLGWWFG